MPTAAVLALGGLTRQRTPRVPESEPFNILGPTLAPSVEPFDLGTGIVVTVPSVEPFDIVGAVAVWSVEPFDSLGAVSRGSVEPFNILGPMDLLLPALDLGDGERYEASAAPLYGWWDPLAGPINNLTDLTCE
jgi:hypothetical protein